MNMATSQQNEAPEVVFYVLNSADTQSLDAFIAKLIQKIVSEKRHADVLFASLQDAQRFDLTLWGIRPQSFIPHSVANEVSAPIQLFGETVTQTCQDVLLNLHSDFQTEFNQYNRTIEILDQTEHLIQKGRERFKQYRSLGIEPLVHKIGY